MKITAEGSLLLGLPYRGKLYFDVKAQALTVGDECLVLEVIDDLVLDSVDNKHKREMLSELAYLAAQIEIIGVPQDALTPAYLLEHLATDDYEILLSLISDVRKKRIAVGESPKTTDEAESKTSA